MLEIEEYALGCGIAPSTVLQKACGYGGGKWASWKSGSSCSLTQAEKLRLYMANNPPKKEGQAA